MSAEFHNESVAEMRLPAVREEFQAALRELEGQLPLAIPSVIGSEAKYGSDLVSTDPCEPRLPIGRARVASREDVDSAVAAASAAFPAWSGLGAEARAEILLRAATIMRDRRHRIAALIVKEAAKPWVEADADVCEAIDFLEYYASDAIELARGARIVSLPGERNRLRWSGRGVAAVIAPWNFPVAIPCGMVAAALATGNAVVLKPAEQTPACAWEFVSALHQAGVPSGVLNLLHGYGDVGKALVRHRDVHIIAFTGSGAVGLEIVRQSAELAEGQQHLKTVVAEMGGKNCILVASDADLDDAVVGIVHSAFGFAGQKCSAGSRVIADAAIAPRLCERLAGAVNALRVGPATDFRSDLAAVIDEEAQRRVLDYIELGRADGTVLTQSSIVPDAGWYCPPTLIGGLSEDSRVLHDEIFGPVLSVEEASSMDEACERVEALPFALTGGLYSRDPALIASVTERMPVGNFYVNRATTGAMVGRQPFGGNRLSGTGTKAGGPAYLLRFVEPRVTTENTVRHGLVV